MHPLPNPPPLASLAGEGAVPCHPPAEGSLPSTRRKSVCLMLTAHLLTAHSPLPLARGTWELINTSACGTCGMLFTTRGTLILPPLAGEGQEGGANPSLTRSVQTRSTTPAPRLDPARSAAGSRTRLPRRAEPGSSTRPSARAG